MTNKAPLEIETLQIKELESAPYNPRRISEEALEGLKGSLERFGLVEPIVWNKRTGRVVGGHQRLKALEALGVSEAQAVVVDLSDEDEKALNVALNNPHLAGEFTEDIGALLAEIGAADSEVFGELNFEDLLRDWTLPDSADGKEFDESAADDVKMVACPECGHEFPK